MRPVVVVQEMSKAERSHSGTAYKGGHPIVCRSLSATAQTSLWPRETNVHTDNTEVTQYSNKKCKSGMQGGNASKGRSKTAKQHEVLCGHVNVNCRFASTMSKHIISGFVVYPVYHSAPSSLACGNG